MANSRQSLVEDRIGEMTECSICTEIFTNPKILPCVHTFCLRCLETYGKDRKPGDQITCPLCRNKFTIPTEGFGNLPNNFFIGKMVEIGKFAVTQVNEAMCNICPEGEEAVAKMFCVECEQIQCERCSKSHKKQKSTVNHQIVELGTNLKAQGFNFRNSYCEHHPGELIKIYCYNENVAICLICCVESHQSHRCANVEKVAGQFSEQLKEDLQKVSNRLPECKVAEESLDKYKKEFIQQILQTEGSIRDTGTKLKALIDQHTEILVQNLKSIREQKLKAIENTKQDVERFRVMIDSYARYCEELISRGSAVDICRAANQMSTRANELEKLPSNCSGNCLRYDTVVFRPFSIESLLLQCKFSNIVGEIAVTESPDRSIKFEAESSGTVIDVGSIPENMAEATLRMILENKRFGGGGEVTNIVFGGGRRSAVITLSDPQVAKRLESQNVIDFKGSRMTITKHVEKDRGQNPLPVGKQPIVPSIIGKERHSSSDRTIKVSNIPSDVNENILLMLFETKVYGGGQIDSIVCDQEKAAAVIMFKDPQVAKTLIKKTVLHYRSYQLNITRAE